MSLMVPASPRGTVASRHLNGKIKFELDWIGRIAKIEAAEAGGDGAMRSGGLNTRTNGFDRENGPLRFGG